ncbi:hypothetical protein ACFFIX_04860 [Metabacillus herbersteinensis]|uniref:LURP-one-related family protein n=1 Tax=Metabacillus herbersteinensis TaxID=283816 RepID=A0ABV6GAT5_9BACI
MTETVYFKDTFFSTGITEIFNGNKEKIGELDHKGAFSSSIAIFDQTGALAVSGKFTFFSRHWVVIDDQELELGILKNKLSFFTKKFEYKTHGRGTYRIESPAFSKEYEIFDKNEELVATFQKTNGFFASPAFQLTNKSSSLSTNELIAVVMGINSIQKAQSAAATSSS